MDQPELYYKSSLITKRDAEEVLSEYANKMHWNSSAEKIIDIGCADGGITANTFKKYIPTNDLKIVGCDVNEEMIKYASEHNSNKNTTFELLDIEKKLPDEHKGKYDHVFAFYILHWVKNHKAMFQNIYNLLNKNGACLVTGLAQMPFFDGYRAISRTEKWGLYLGNVEEYVSQYHDCPDPVPVVTNIMEEAGFKDVYVVCRSKIFVFDTAQDLKDLLQAVNAFDIPQEKLNDYYEDLLRIILMNKMMELQTNENQKNTKIQMKYKFMIAFGRK